MARGQGGFYVPPVMERVAGGREEARCGTTGLVGERQVDRGPWVEVEARREAERGGPEEGTTHHGGAARPIGGVKRKAGCDRTASIAPRRCGCRPASRCTSARCVAGLQCSELDTTAARSLVGFSWGFLLARRPYSRPWRVGGAVTDRICSDRTSGLVAADELEKTARPKCQ